MSVRTQRVARLIQRDIAEILAREFDTGFFFTVTNVRVNRDLSIAYVAVSVFADTLEERQAAFELLTPHTARIRSLLAQRIRHQMRAVPSIRFFLDETEEEARKMDALLEATRKEREGRHAGA